MQYKFPHVETQKGTGSTVPAHPWYLHVEFLQTPRCIHNHAAMYKATYKYMYDCVYLTWTKEKNGENNILRESLLLFNSRYQCRIFLYSDLTFKPEKNALLLRSIRNYETQKQTFVKSKLNT